jgi:AcrR family transcriptional regulator
MGTADRIERERHEKRARILEAARTLFVERGIDSVTLREIAQRIDYSTTAIYVHFKDKAALVEAMVNEDFAVFARGLEAAARITDPLARLKALHSSYIEFALEMPHHYQLLFMTPAKQQVRAVKDTDQLPSSPAGIEGYRVLHMTVEECVAAGHFRDPFSDVDGTTQVIWANVHGLVSLLITMESHAHFHWRSRTTLAKLSYDMVMGGLLKAPASRDTKKKR